MNAPKDKVNDIVKVLPGIKSPTIMPLAESDWCSIHTVLDETRFGKSSDRLKQTEPKVYWYSLLKNDSLSNQVTSLKTIWKI